jgi:hypothetical protein
MEVLPFLVLFFFDGPGQRKTAWEKRNPSSGDFYKKYQNPNHCYSKFHAKLNS